MSVYEHDNTPIPQQHTHQECGHGHCLDHSPQWERTGEPFFNLKPFVFLWWRLRTFKCHVHCEKNMCRMSKHVRQQCKLCGRMDVKLLEELVAYCGCCGYNFRHDSGSLAQKMRDRIAARESKQD